MSTSPKRRSPSLESISSVSSAFSLDDNPGIIPISPQISIQSVSQGGVTNLWTQAEQEDWLPESEGMGRITSLRDAHSNLFEAPQAPVEAYPMHERFCFPAENIYFLVEGVLYSVHRYFFERDSSSFAGQGLSRREPMVLANVSTHNFDLFLSILYPTSFGVYPASTVEEWSGILHLADKWNFLSIRALAITQIAPIASPIDKIVFGRLYGIHEWLPGAYHEVCARPNALCLEEGRRLGVDDVIRINAIRQEFCFVRVSESSSKLFEGDVETRFGLAIQTKHSASVESLPEGGILAGHQDEEVGREMAIAENAKTTPTQAEETREDHDRHADIQARPVTSSNDTGGVSTTYPNGMSGISNTPVGTAANEEDWSQLTPSLRYWRKVAKAQKEIYADECAEVLKQARQQLANEAKGAEGGVTQQGVGGTSDVSDGTSGASNMEPNGMSGASNTSMGTVTNEKDDWSHLTPSDRYSKKVTKFLKEKEDEERAELVKEVEQQLANEAKAAEEAASV